MYLIRRLLYLPLSLLLLSLVCFALRGFVPGDVVAASLPSVSARQATEDPAAYDRIYRRAAAALGRDLPPFYFSIRNAALPDTLDRIARPAERRMVRALTLDAGRWGPVSAYYLILRQTAYPSQTATDQSETTTLVARRLLTQDDPAQITPIIRRLEAKGQATSLTETYRRIYLDSDRTALLLPAFHWYGTQNQYHRWLGNLLTGDLGVSYSDGQPVAAKIARALPWTLLLNFLAIIVVFAVSVPLGLHLAGHAGSRRDRWATLLLFLLFGIPSFWAATLLANFFTTPAYGMDFFPSMGVGDIEPGDSWLDVLLLRGRHLFLPVVCMAYPSLAYITRHLRQATLRESAQGYVNTARMKGLSERRIRWKHIFRNASFPLITIFGSLFPQLLAGSILIERIFNLPGMGRLLYVSAADGDWPVVIVLILLNGVLTAAGLLFADVIYTLVDPRVNLSRPTSLHAIAN